MLSPSRALLPPLLLLAAPGLACEGTDPEPAATDTDTTTATSVGTTVAATATQDGTQDGTDTEPEPLPPLPGHADLHLHMFAEAAFGGGWFHGQSGGPAEVALSMCDGGDPGDHARMRSDLSVLFDACDPAVVEDAAAQVPLLSALLSLDGAFASELLGNVPGTDGDTGLHEDRRGGWPELDGWPRWDAIAHQQVWEEWLHDAYDSGLRLAVISAVSFDWLCRALPPENLERPKCDEMDDVLVQLQMANDFDAATDWAEIALTAADARRIIDEGKLALVLSIEASHIFGTGDWRAQLDEVHALGVRTLQPVHQLDNRFGGAAPHITIFQIAQFGETCRIDPDCGLTGPGVTLGFDVDTDCRNTLGLTDEGRELVEAMIERSMPIDLAHMSEALVADVYDVAVAHDYYPLYLSHAHFREIMLPGKAAEEKTTPSWVIGMVRETGGMVGLRTAHEEVNTYDASPVENACHGSARSFAQAYDYGRMGLGVPMGLGSDLNGFIQQTRPRYGQYACSASFPEEAACQARDERQAGVALGTEFDEWGLGHIGLLDDLVDDLDQLGTDTEPLRRSADAYVVMWERASGERSGPAADPSDIDTTGITVLPSHLEREAELPTECDLPYCPGALTSGQECRFDAECESGTCAGAGACGEPTGLCE